ncbi:hypothetical protein BHM03_00040713 [Ensete ventricosum]|nr:hypothetical protein BHM03_00040713 [Ensete ventricosum]
MLSVDGKPWYNAFHHRPNRRSTDHGDADVSERRVPAMASLTIRIRCSVRTNAKGVVCGRCEVLQRLPASFVAVDEGRIN